MAFYKQCRMIITRCIIPYNNHLQISGTRHMQRWVSPTLKELQRRRDKVGLEPEKPRSTFLEWNYDAELFAFGKRLGEELDRKLLEQALIQREYVNLLEFKSGEQGVPPTPISHNYELVEEGNNLINNYVVKELNKHYPEDIATAVYKYLTTEDMLAHIGSHIGLKDIVLTTEFPVSKKTLSDSFKAVVAALQRSQDTSRAENFVKDFVLTQLNGKDVYEIWDPKEPYEYLTKLVQQKGMSAVEPRLCNQSATKTILACFQVGLYSDKKLLGLGWGENIKIAKETAAVNAIQRLFNHHLNKN